MTEVLFKIAGINVVDIKSEEDDTYIEGGCPTCGGDYYYNKSLFLIDEKGSEHEIAILKDDPNETISSVPLTLLAKLLSDDEVKEVIEFMRVDEFEHFLYNTLYIYDQLTYAEGEYITPNSNLKTYIDFLEDEFFCSYIRYCEESANAEEYDYYYSYPHILKDEYLQAVKNHYEGGSENERD